MHSGHSASLQDSLSANTPEGGLEPAMRPTWATASKSARMRAMALCMAGHQRLGEFSPLRELGDLFDTIMTYHQLLEIVVPDEFTTLEAALNDISPGQTVRMRKGVHGARGTTNENSKFGGVQVQIRSEIELIGDPGAELRFGLIFRKQSRGAIRNLAVVNSGGDALTVLGGEWEVDNCRVQSRGECALTAANQSVVHLRESLIGGSAARPVASRFDASWGENAKSGVAVGGKARCFLRDCTVQHCRTALCFGNKEGGVLAVHDSRVAHTDYLLLCRSGKGAARLCGVALEQIRVEVWAGSERTPHLEVVGCTLDDAPVDDDYFYS